MFGKKPPPQLSSDLQIILLDEIAKRLADQAAEGVFSSRQLPVNTTWLTMLETSWLAATIFNDGEADVYLRLDDMSTLPWEMGEAPLKKGESIRLDLKAKLYKPLAPDGAVVKPLRSGSPVLCFICQSGTADVRVFRLA